MLHNTTLELVCLLVDKLNCVDSNLERAPLLVALCIDLTDSEDPLETALSEAILNQQEAFDRF